MTIPGAVPPSLRHLQGNRHLHVALAISGWDAAATATCVVLSKHFAGGRT
ncbi:MAG: hypothetical protein ACLQU1_24170 [Bryobacteraceae bacterium]